MHYNGPIVRPGDEADSIFIEVTVGCTHNKCTFCNFYEGFPYRVTPFEQVEASLQEASQYKPYAKKVWASGGNPFALSVEKLSKLAKLFKKYLPEAVINTYARVNDFYKKSVEDIRHLKNLGYDNIVIGIESGDDEVLLHTNKGYTAADIERELKKLEAAGMAYRVIYLGGLAGHGKVLDSAQTTVNLLNQLHPTLMYLTTVAILPGTQLYEETKRGEFVEATELERLEEFRLIIKELTNPIRIWAITATNSVSFVADLPKDKAAIVSEFDEIIANFDERVEQRLSARRHSMRYV